MMLEVTRYEFLLNVSVHAVLGDVFRRNMKSRPCHEFRGRDMMQDHLGMEKKQQVHNKGIGYGFGLLMVCEIRLQMDAALNMNSYLD
ncbi:hypothetical protein Tco_1028074 [Tanacetum coccineum]